MSRELECPRCLTPHREVERFCKSCGMPLVYPERASGDTAGETRRRGRKINPRYTEGPLVKVARAANLVQAEFLAGLLLEEGIPCMLDSRASIIAPYAPVAAPHDVLVHESALEAAREALSSNGPLAAAPSPPPPAE